MRAVVKRTILIGADNPILRTKTVPVQKVTKEILKLIKDLAETVKSAEGLGIAAPQVGESVRVCIARFAEKMNPMINPQITWKSGEISTDEEGCLSLPEIFVQVPRAKEITVRFLDMKGKEQERKLSDLDARVVQHEVDHLDGKLIVDYK